MPAEVIPAVVWELADGLRRVLGEQLLGIYLGGSWSMGDFVPSSSDDDVLVVVAAAFTGDQLAALARLHRRLRRMNPDAVRLEGDYAPRPMLIPSGTTAPVPGFRRGVFIPSSSEIMLSADNLANFRKDGRTVLGPPPKQLLPEVSPDDVRAAVRAMLAEIPVVVATEAEAANAILNLLRSWCALESGEPTSKSQGAAWALARLDPRWHPAIHRALAARRGEPIPTASRLLREFLLALASPEFPPVSTASK